MKTENLRCKATRASRFITQQCTVHCPKDTAAPTDPSGPWSGVSRGDKLSLIGIGGMRTDFFAGKLFLPLKTLDTPMVSLSNHEGVGRIKQANTTD